MDEIKLPQHVVNRIERRWTARFAQAEDWQRPERTPCYRPTEATILFNRCKFGG
jgi:hypothetical protein